MKVLMNLNLNPVCDCVLYVVMIRENVGMVMYV